MLPKESGHSVGIARPLKELPHRPSYRSETLTSGPEIFDRLLGMIGSAKKSIDLQFYTFEADKTGRKVLDALRAIKEKNPDLQIRLLIDGSNDFRHDGGSVWVSKEARAKRDETYEVINQMKDEGIFDAKMTNWASHNPFSALIASNIIHRDHKKLAIIDGAVREDSIEPKALVTSANVAWYHEDVRKELGRIYYGTDGPVPYLAKDFESSFHQAKEWEHVYSVRSIGEYLHKYGLFNKTFFKDALGSIVRNPQSPGERMVFVPGQKDRDSAVLTDSFWGKAISKPIEALLHKKIGAQEATDEAFSMVDHAKPGDKIVIFSPYPGIYLLTSKLIKSAKRGVEVHLIISGSYEHELIDPHHLKGIKKPLELVYGRWPKRLANNGVVLHEYNGELHAKGAIWERSDGSVRTLITSSNFSKGPISGMNREVGVVEETDKSDPLIPYADDLIEHSTTHQPTKMYLRRS